MDIQKQEALAMAFGIHKLRRAPDEPIAFSKPNQRFVPIPSKFKKPKGDLNISLSDIVNPAVITRINAAGKIIFHTVGDTGGIHDDAAVQSSLAAIMEKQITGAQDHDKPSFFYHLGDVVYFNGLTADYPTQFDEPYKYYPAVIMAVPGNHDGQINVSKGDPPDKELSLQGFMENFCDSQQRFSRFSSYRKTMNQPWPYWVLNASFITFIGLYSNIDGSLDDINDSTQYEWLVSQLKKAPADKCLVITIHHPPYSLDTAHGGYHLIGNKLDAAFAEAGRLPNIVFSGHVHNYQRFTRVKNGKDIVYSVSGAGGYANTARIMHKIFEDPKTHKLIKTPFKTKDKEVTLAKYNETNPGFLRISVDKTFLTGEYFIDNFDGSTPPSKPFDSFKMDWTKHKVIK